MSTKLPRLFHAVSEYDVSVSVRDMNAQCWSECLKSLLWPGAHEYLAGHC